VEAEQLDEGIDRYLCISQCKRGSVASGVNERLGSLTVQRFYRSSPEDITGGDLELQAQPSKPNCCSIA